MNYHLRPKDKKKNRKVATFAIFAGALLLILILIPEPSAGIVHSVAAPVWRIRDGLGEAVVSAVVSFKDETEIIRENKNLKESIKNLQLKILDRDLLYEENLALKEALGRFPEKGAVFAGVLAKPGTSPYDTFVLDVGERSGIQIGDRVFASGSVLIGEIDRVFKDTSRARLYSTSGVKTDVVIGDTGIFASAVGRGGGNFEIELPKEVGVELGDYIVSPGLGPKIFGVIENIEDRPADSFQTVLFKSPVNMAQVENVFVEIDTQND